MAKVEEGINGGFTGKVGTVTGYLLNGQWVMRSAKRRKSKKNKIGSEKQNASRSAFTKMQKFLSPVVPFIRTGFNIESKKKFMTAHNAAKSYNMLNAQDANGEIDYTKVSLTFGTMKGATDAAITVDDVGVHFSWNTETGGDYVRATDQVMLIAYDVEGSSVFADKSGVKRSVGKQTLEITRKTGQHTYHTWISFISDDREEISMSTYCGSFEFPPNED